MTAELRDLFFFYRGLWSGDGGMQCSGGDGVHPENRNYCAQLHAKPQECLSHGYPKCSPTCSVPQSFVPLRLFPRHDEAIIFEAASYSSRCNGTGCMSV